jgi:molybdopterin synthase catalytic subunit
METLKHAAPFWKRETLADGSVRWVEKNTQG